MCRACIDVNPHLRIQITPVFPDAECLPRAARAAAAGCGGGVNCERAGGAEVDRRGRASEGGGGRTREAAAQQRHAVDTDVAVAAGLAAGLSVRVVPEAAGTHLAAEVRGTAA